MVVNHHGVLGMKPRSSRRAAVLLIAEPFLQPIVYMLMGDRMGG